VNRVVQTSVTTTKEKRRPTAKYRSLHTNHSAKEGNCHKWM